MQQHSLHRLCAGAQPAARIDASHHSSASERLAFGAGVAMFASTVWRADVREISQRQQRKRYINPNERHTPGRAKLSTMPRPTGSPTRANTIGTVRVSCLSAIVPWVPEAWMISGVSASWVSASGLGVALIPSIVDPRIAADDPARC